MEDAVGFRACGVFLFAKERNGKWRFVGCGCASGRKDKSLDFVEARQAQAQDGLRFTG